MKKLFALAILLLMAAMPALAVTEATPIIRAGDYTYVVRADGTAQIVCWDGPEAVVSVPEALEGHDVTSIRAFAFADCPGLVEVTLPASIQDLGEGAFTACTNLEKVNLSEGLKRIGSTAFDGCQVLLSIALPDSLVEVADNPFRGCSNLYDIRVSDAHPYLRVEDGVLFSRPDHRLVCYPMGKTDGRYVVPEGTETIGAMAFDRDLFVQEIVLPDSLVEIGREAFNGCDALKAMNLPSGVQVIGEFAMRCSNLVLTLEDDTDYGPQLV